MFDMSRIVTFLEVSKFSRNVSGKFNVNRLVIAPKTLNQRVKQQIYNLLEIWSTINLKLV